MDYSSKYAQPNTVNTACVIVGIYAKRKLSPAAALLDQASGGAISALCKKGDVDGQLGHAVMLYDIPNIAAQRVLLVGCGNSKTTQINQYQNIHKNAVQTLNKHNLNNAVSYLCDISIDDRDVGWHFQQAVMACADSLYRFDECKSEKNGQKSKLRKLIFGYTERKYKKAAETGIHQGQAIASGINTTKDLGNLPGNICTPNYLAKQARALQRKHSSIKTTILDEAQMQKLGMGSLLSVSRGSREPAKLIVMQYMQGKKGKKPVVLVGKGITFDTGGISLKPGQAMDEMKYDMCGAASVFGAITACAEMELPVNLVAVVAAAENMPSGEATKPGDIVTSMSGLTIEVLNTDAEGRLVLCDALSYVERFDPAAVIDIATLTGACIIALGRVPSGLMSNKDKLAQELMQAGENAGDRAWQMPLWPEYKDMLASNFADMANIGGREAGSLTAAAFLSRFTENYPWAHLDVAGTAWKTGKAKGATGRPVPLLMQYIMAKHAS